AARHPGRRRGDRRGAARAPPAGCNVGRRADRGDGVSVGETRVLEHRYTAYHGERRGRAAAVWSLARWSALTALGARRSWRAKLVPGFLIAVAALPALIDIGLKALIPEFSRRFPDLIPYAQYYTETGITVLLFAGVITPELLCPDRRDRVLSLYFS